MNSHGDIISFYHLPDSDSLSPLPETSSSSSVRFVLVCPITYRLSWFTEVDRWNILYWGKNCIRALHTRVYMMCDGV